MWGLALTKDDMTARPVTGPIADLLEGSDSFPMICVFYAMQ